MRGADDLKLATLGWVHYFKHTRLHSSLIYRPRGEVKAAEYYRHIHAVEQPLKYLPSDKPGAFHPATATVPISIAR